MAFAEITTILGGFAAGTGATIVTEGAIMSAGHKYATTKLGKFCVDMCAVTVGSAAFTKVSDMFTEQALEFWETVDKVKAHIKDAKKNGVSIDISSEHPMTESEKQIREELQPEDE